MKAFREDLLRVRAASWAASGDPLEDLRRLVFGLKERGYLRRRPMVEIVSAFEYEFRKQLLAGEPLEVAFSEARRIVYHGK